MTGDWRSHAHCLGMDGEIFFPTAAEGPTYEAQVAAAKAVCAGCSVRPECLAEALIRIPYGIAGGLTPEERRGRVSHVAPEPAEAIEAGLRAGADRTEREAAARLLLTAGRTVREVAHRCGVGERTAARWAARARTTNAGEGSTGGNRAPLLISHTTDTQPGTRTQEEV